MFPDKIAWNMSLTDTCHLQQSQSCLSDYAISYYVSLKAQQHIYLADENLLKNYRPISNLPFLSKILEKVVLHKLLSHLQANNLCNPFQSAYRAGHSTETVLLCVVHNILSALDNDNISVLLLLDLSAAFDTADHQILLSCLYSLFGVQSTALK